MGKEKSSKQKSLSVSKQMAFWWNRLQGWSEFAMEGESQQMDKSQTTVAPDPMQCECANVKTGHNNELSYFLFVTVCLVILCCVNGKLQA